MQVFLGKSFGEMKKSQSIANVKCQGNDQLLTLLVPQFTRKVFLETKKISWLFVRHFRACTTSPQSGI